MKWAFRLAIYNPENIASVLQTWEGAEPWFCTCEGNNILGPPQDMSQQPAGQRRKHVENYKVS